MSFPISIIKSKLSFPFDIFFGKEIEIEDFFNEFYLEPNIKIYGAENINQDSIQISSIIRSTNKVIVIGPLGCGKSTFLFSKYFKVLQNNDLEKLSEKAIFYTLDQLIENNKILEECQLKPERITFVDSFDETSLEFDRKQLATTMEELLTLPNLVLACRSPFFYEYFSENTRGKFDFVLEIQPMTVQEQFGLAEKYLSSKDARYSGANKATIDRATSIIQQSRGYHGSDHLIVSTPLFTALCSMVALDPTEKHRLGGVTGVYEAFIQSLIVRKFQAHKNGINLLCQFSWILDQHRIKRIPMLNSDYKNIFDDEFLQKIHDLVLLRPTAVSNVDSIRDFRHRSIGEYLVARHIVFSFTNETSSDEIEKWLGRLYNYETSYFIRRLISETPREQGRAIINKLKDYVRKNYNKNEPDKAIATHNSLYFASSYIERDDQFLEEISKLILSDQATIHPLVSGTLLSCVISEAQEETENILLTALETDKKLMWRNIRYHLFYYGDVEFADIDTLTAPISRNTSWDGTRSILLERLLSSDQKRLRFRAYDLLTLFHFISVTDYNFSLSEVETLKDGIKLSRELADALSNQWKSEFIRKLCSLLENTIQEKGLIKSQLESRTNELLNEKPKMALIMKGGGVKGLAYIGALKHLVKHFDFDWYIGTSAGAIAAVLLGAGYSVGELEKILFEKDFTEFLDGKGFGLLLNILAHQGLHKGDSFNEFIEEKLQKKIPSLEPVKFKQFPKKVTVYACKTFENAVIYDSNDSLGLTTGATYAVRCSMSIPFLFTPQKEQGFNVFDGGMRNNFPVEIFLKHNPGIQFVGLYLGAETYKYEKPNIFKDMMRIWIETTDYQALRKYQDEIIIIDPEPIKTIDFDLTKEAKEFLILAGEVAALKYLQKKGLDTQINLTRLEQELVTKRDIVSRFFKIRRRRRLVILAALAILCVILFCGVSLGVLLAVYPYFI